MEIGTIGAGAFAQAFAKRALKAGHRVKLSNSRGPDSLREIVNQLGPGAMAATTEEAAACEMVLLAVPWDNVPETLASFPMGPILFTVGPEISHRPMLETYPLASLLRR